MDEFIDMAQIGELFGKSTGFASYLIRAYPAFPKCAKKDTVPGNYSRAYKKQLWLKADVARFMVLYLDEATRSTLEIHKVESVARAPRAKTNPADPDIKAFICGRFLPAGEQRKRRKQIETAKKQPPRTTKIRIGDPHGSF